MGCRSSYALIFSILLGPLGLQAQPCSIDLGPDHTICQGQTVTLTAPAGFPNYLWSTGSLGTSITVGTGGTYWGQVSYPSGQLFPNSNFNAGNTGFSSDFINSTVLAADGNYWIGTNPNTYHGQFFGTGNGNFMIVNSGWPSALWNVYCQSVVVCPEQTYTMSYRVRTISNATPARLQWWVDGAPVGPEVTLPAFNAGWQTITQSWTSGVGQTNANLCLRVMSGEGVGNDFGLDDITMQGTIVLRDDVVVNVTPLPAFDLGPNATLCNGQNLVLDAAVPGGSYVWQDGATTPDYVVSGPGIYSVTVTANGCPRTDAITVNYNPLPVVDLGPDLTLCTGQTQLLSAATPGASYIWQNGSISSFFNVNGPGTFSVQVTVNGCSTTDAVDVSYNPTPVVNLGPDVVACDGETVTLDATTPSATYLWSDGSGGATLDVTTDASPSVTVTVNGCPGTDAANVSFTPLPIVDLGPDQTVCPGTAVLLDATVPGGSYVWQDGSTAATFNATSPGTYSVTVTANDCSSSDSFNLSHFTLQMVDLGPDLTICQGQGVTIGDVVAGASYTWNTGAVTNSIGVSTAGIYWLDVTLNGCTVRDSVEVSVTPLPVFTLGTDRTICPGTTTVLDATTPSASYLWNTGASTPTLTVTPGSYDVVVTANGCSRTDAISIAAFTAPTVDLGPDITLCPGTNFVLDATQTGASYLWQDGSAASTFNVSSGGIYSIQLTDANGCVANDAINVTYDDPAPISLGPDVALCQGETMVLDATVPGATYAWSNGASTPTITVDATGTYAVVVTQGQCTVGDDIDVAVEALPTVDLGPDVGLCPGETVVLDATGTGLSYAWSTGAVTPTITATANGIYSVTVENAAGCTASDAITVTYATPDAVDLGPDLVLCQGETAVLDATLAGAAYLWSTGASTPTLTVSTSGTYSVTVTQGTCAVTDAIGITVNPMPQADLGNDITLCAGENTVLDATWPGASYTWSTGASTPTITASTSGTYSVEVDLDGCTAIDEIDVTVLSATSVNIGPDATVCDGTTVTLDATTPGATYLWSTGATTPTIAVTTSGTYAVEVFVGQCSVTDEAIITVNPMPQADLGNDITLCAGENTVLDATWPGASYTWSTGASTPTITASTSGTFSVEVDLDGCTANDEIDVTVLSSTSVNIGPDATVCDGTTVTLDATTPGATYLWSTGAATPTIAVTTSGTYAVEVFVGQCSVTDEAIITVNPMPQADLGNDITLCAGENALLDATWPGASYTWSTGASTPTITASTSGTFSVEVDLDGCTANDEIEVTVLSATSVNIGPDATVCDGTTVTLDATTPGATYLWSTGAVTPTIAVTTSGTYAVEVFVGQCSVTDEATITVEATPEVDLGPDLVFCGGELSATLDATWPGATFLWSTGETSPSITVQADGTYDVTVALGNCSATDEIQVAFGSMNYDLGPDMTLCPNETLVLGADLPSGVSTWNNSTVAPTYTVEASGVYALHFENANGCEIRDTITVTYVTAAELDLGTDLILCDGESTVLDASIPGATYLWTDGFTDAIRTVTLGGTYGVEVFIGDCSVSDEVSIVFQSPPVVDLGPDQAICPGELVTLDATTTNASYLWNDGSTAGTNSVSTEGTVTVNVTVNGCTSSDAVNVSLLDAPVVFLGNDTTICAGASLSLDVMEPNTDFIWDDGSTDALRTVTQAGIYWVDASRNTCVHRDSVEVTVFSPADLDLGPDQAICVAGSVEFGVILNGASYLWNTGSTSAVISASEAGTYSVAVNVAGCSAFDEVELTLISITPPDLGPDVSRCAGETVELAVAATDVTWSTGATGPVLTVSEPGLYSVTVDSAGCSATDAIYVDFTELVTDIDLGADRTICAGAFEVLVANSIPGATYAWNTGASGAYVSVAEPGIYSVHATGLCIDATDSVLILPGDCDTYLYVPNAFTPNGDLINDHFLPALAGPVDSFTLDIFDRWGERIHTTADREAGWDGTCNGVDVQDGVYVWTVNYRVLGPQGVKNERLVGHVTLLR